MSGRPLRFLFAAAVGWASLRTMVLWSTDNPAVAVPRDAVASAESGLTDRRASIPDTPPLPPIGRARAEPAPRIATRPVPSVRIAAVPVDPAAITSPWPGVTPALTMPPLAGAVQSDPPIAPFATPLPGRLPPAARWSGGTWLAMRGGDGAAAGLGGGRIGGSQAGARLAYAVDPAKRIAVVGRVTSPIRGAGREAAIGLEWRPSRLPVRLVVEHRVALDGGRGGPAAGVIAGTGPARAAFGLDLESYGQAGVIRRDRAEAFAEGTVRLSRPFVSLGRIRLDIGAGAWGGAQRGARRLDVGPSVGARLPLAGKPIRVMLDWRRRIAGDARPGSGPALTVGLDF